MSNRSAAEEQLQALVGGEDWSLAGAPSLSIGLDALKSELDEIVQGSGLLGTADQAARAAAQSLVEALSRTGEAIGNMNAAIAQANAHRADVAAIIDGLPSMPSWVSTAIRTAEAGTVVTTGGLSVVAGEGALGMVSSFYAQERAKAAAAAVKEVTGRLDETAESLSRATAGLGFDTDDTGTETGSQSTGEGVPASSTTWSGRSRSSASSVAAVAGAAGAMGALIEAVAPVPSSSSTGGGTGAGPGSNGVPARPGATTPSAGTSTGSGTSGRYVAVDGKLTGTTSVTGGGAGVPGGLGASGLAGSASGRGLSAGVLGAAGLTAGSRLSGGLTGAGSGASAGTSGLGGASSARGLASSVGTGAGGTTGRGLSGSTAAGEGASGSASGAAGSSARGGTSGMLGGGGAGGASEKDKRRGLAGFVAPTLEDEPEAAPLPAAAGPGSR